MNSEIIYEKKFPREDDLELLEYLKSHKDKPIPPPPITFDEFYSSIFESITLAPLPERQKSINAFIQAAVDVSEMYEVDITIKRYDSHINAIFTFEWGYYFSNLSTLFSMADRYCFFRNENLDEFIISLDYYTHAVYKNDNLLAPTAIP